MDVRFTDGTPVLAVPGARLPHAARWDVAGRSVIAGPYADGDAHERHVLETVGSGTWHRSPDDEFRFDPDTLELRSLWLKVPERESAAGETLDDWLGEPPVDGTLRLAAAGAFAPEPMTMLQLGAGGDLLAGGPATEGGDRLRLRVADGLDLLFEGGLMTAWLLADAPRHLTPPAETTPALVDLLRAYLERVAAADDLLRKDPRALEQLRALQARASELGAPAVQETVADIIERRYG